MSRLSHLSWTACAGPAALIAPPPATAPPPPPRPAPAPENARPPSQPPTPAAHRLHLTPSAGNPAQRHLQAGRDATAQGRLDQAIASFDQALAHDPTLTIAHLCRSLCLLSLHRQDEAAAALHQALQTAPHDPHTRLDLARICARTGLHPIALHLLTHTLQQAPHLTHQTQTDPAFTTLHDHPIFHQITGRL